MHDKFKGIKAVGFDLDRTLYADTPEMIYRIQAEIFRLILIEKPELGSISAVAQIYSKEIARVGNWSKVLGSIGFKDPMKIGRDCLRSANIIELIKRDQILVDIIKQLECRYFLFLITGSSRNFAYLILEKLGVPYQSFKFSLFGDDDIFITKHKPNNFISYLSSTQFLPWENVYIGDNRQTDIIIPKSLGMMTIAVGKCIRDADFSVDHIHDISGLLL